MPVHTAQAVLSGSVRSAMLSRTMLPTRAATVATVGPLRVNPSVYFRPTAQATSSRPARSKMPHAVLVSPSLVWGRPHVRIWETGSSPCDLVEPKVAGGGHPDQYRRERTADIGRMAGCEDVDGKEWRADLWRSRDWRPVRHDASLPSGSREAGCPEQEVVSFRGARRSLSRGAVVQERALGVAGALQEMCPDGIEPVVPRQPSLGVECIEPLESDCGSVHHGRGDRLVQR